jgi:electron transfer flavoprotein beta subunit
VPDTSEADVKIDPSGKDIIKERLAFTINESDNYALEEALLAKEKLGGNVTLVSVGPKQAEEVLRMGLAKGATAAVRIDDAGLSGADPVSIARVLSGFFSGKSFDLIFTGCIASDDGSSQVGPALAELLGLPHAAYVTKLEYADAAVKVKRELEGGLLEVKEIARPCVVTIQTGGNSPRYASIMGIKRAGAKPVETLDHAVVEPQTDLVRLFVPEISGAAEMIVGTVDEKAAKMAQLIKEKGVL